MQTEILDAKVTFVEQPFVSPLILSSGAITVITEAQAEVTIRVDGREGVGRGSIYLSDLWAWPEPSLTHEQRDAVLRGICEDIAGNLWDLCGREAVHPLELGLRLHENVCDKTTPPALARAMCASPFDAAIHDAVGIALGVSAFDFYKTPASLPTADPYFDGDANAAIAGIIRAPKNELKAWYVVGKNDTEKDLAPWVRDRGYRCLKIKILGQDNGCDVSRTVEAFRMAENLGARDIELSVDTNEANPDAASVLDYLRRLEAADAEAFAALQYFEQPTGRDITVHKFDWHEISKLKPVMLDEGLTSLELMQTAADQGWSGFALKTCKGHSFALVAAAWAKRHGLLISLQDLTNPGLSMIHAALFAAHVSMINDVELNSPQFTPAANADWLPRLDGLFELTGGVHRLETKNLVGLGSTM
ncbi:MAG: hypothetical protein K8S55_02070 [Phycisphaerae bacterium]|nr:hypothetical protein [Phycisphaerae bacterium]